MDTQGIQKMVHPRCRPWERVLQGTPEAITQTCSLHLSGKEGTELSLPHTAHHALSPGATIGEEARGAFGATYDLSFPSNLGPALISCVIRASK